MELVLENEMNKVNLVGGILAKQLLQTWGLG